MEKIKVKILSFLLNSFAVGSFMVQLMVIYRYFFDKSQIAENDFTIVPLIIFVFILLAILLLKKKKYQISAIIFLVILFGVTIIQSIKYGVDLPQATVMYSLVIVMSGILLGKTYPIICSIIISTSLLLIFSAQSNNPSLLTQNWKQMDMAYDDFFAMTVLFVLMSVISWIFTKEIYKSIAKAENEEKKALKLANELQIERDSLEIKVEKRTKELRESQLRELVKINNLAEFGRLSAGLLHDIKNPLTVILLNLDTLKSKKDKETVDLINKSLLAAKTAETIIKSSQKQLSIKDDIQEFDLVTEIKNTILLVEHRALREKIEIITDFSDKKLYINSYPAKLARVIANLLMNAIDSFDGVFDRKRKIKIKASEQKNKILITIEDNGCGIKEEDIKNLFTPFLSKKNIEGRMGLGLYGSYKMINEELNGKISCKSKINIGTTFNVELKNE